MESYSVLMSVYFKEKPEFLKESIDSILNQTVLTNDFVLVCDGPLTPELDAVIAGYENKYPDLFQVIRLEKNLGLGRALNVGMDCCKNDLIARMDSDDISLPDRCEKQIELFASRSNLDIVSGSVAEFTDTPDKINAVRALPQTQNEIKSFIGKRNPINHPCVMYRKNSVLSAGGYQHFPLFEDYYLWARMFLNGAVFYNLSDTLLYMRAGSEMYQRRAGSQYLKTMWKFRWFLRKNHIASWKDFLVSSIGQSVVCIIPNKLREKLYQKLLRK
jgi:glycosyltransferase involved in cell wall biosynthesis